ncbi:MAG: RNA methyltransferase [Fusobacterium sp.]|nr:RNA methyltransferase [Fusobacterium sp.]
MEITSVNNELVKETVKLQQKKFRDSEGKFLLEGFKAIEEAHSIGLEIDKIFVLKEKASRYSFAKDKLIETTEAVLKKISTTDSAPEAVGVACQKIFDKETLKTAQKVLLLEGIKDVGNLGTILRSAAAFNVDAVILYGNCTDIYNPKCVRASVGNLCKTPVFHIEKLEELKQYFDKSQRIATLPRSTNLLKTFQAQKPMLIMFGSEADGLSDELIDYSTTSVKIEMNPSVESLNLSISCGILLYNIN